MSTLSRGAALGVLIPLLAALGACDGDRSLLDGSARRDASLRDASGLLDAGLLEAGPPEADAQPLDAGAPSCVATCDPRTGDGCGTGGSCVLHGSTVACVSLSGMGEPGSACTRNDECAVGSACFRVDGAGVCARLCCPGDDAACAAGALCGGAGTLVDGAETEWGRCLSRRSCDVLDAAADCEDREGCYIVDERGATECRVAGTAGADERCAVQQDCQPGFFCGGFGPAKTCQRICSLELDECPSDEGRCVGFAHNPEGSGICTLDMAAREQQNR